MTGAYIEIIVMLLGAFLLGMFVAWQYWRKKYQQLQEAHERLQQDHEKLRADLAQLKSDHDKLKQSHQQLESSYGQLKADSENDLKELNGEVSDLKKKNRAKNKELRESKSKVKTLKEEISVLDDELAAAHDELLAAKKKPGKSSYYRYIDGKRYKAITIKKADEAVDGKGDGRISEEDAREIFSTISDGKQYTPTEKATIRRLRENYKWTERADKVFRHLVGSWAAHDHNVDEINE